jgi:hypothetical protein
MTTENEKTSKKEENTEINLPKKSKNEDTSQSPTSKSGKNGG